MNATSIERLSNLLVLCRVQSILAHERCRTHGTRLIRTSQRLPRWNNSTGTTHEKSIFSPTAWFCHPRCALRMARRKKLPSAGCCFLGRPVHSHLAAPRNGLVGVIADELRPRVGGRTFQHRFRACAGSPQSRTASCYSGCQRLWSRRRTAFEPRGRVRFYRLFDIDVANVNQWQSATFQMLRILPLLTHILVFK